MVRSKSGEVMFLGFGAKKGSPAANTEPYRPYTTQFDQIATAASLLTPRSPETEAMLDQLRAPTPAQLRATQRALKFQGRYRSGHDLGARPLFTLLIDHSGSMRGAKAMAAAILADVVGGVLDVVRRRGDAGEGVAQRAPPQPNQKITTSVSLKFCVVSSRSNAMDSPAVQSVQA